MILRFSAAFALLILASSPAPAQNPMGKAQEACASDIARLCPKVQPGEGRVAKCLKAQLGQVSFRCKLALREAKQAHDAQAAAAAQAPASPPR